MCVALELEKAAVSSPPRVAAGNETISHFSGQDNNELHLSSLQSLAYPKGRPNDIAIHPVPGGYFESNTPAPAIRGRATVSLVAYVTSETRGYIEARKVTRLNH